jgi:hypothetical protein
MSPNAIAIWTFTTVFLVLMLAAVVYCRYLLHRQPRTADTDDFGFYDLDIMTSPTTSPTVPMTSPLTPRQGRLPAYLDITALRPSDDTSL